jgi:hypothetical protein
MTSRLRHRPLRRWLLDIIVIGVGVVLGAVLFTTIQRDRDPPPLETAVEPLVPDLVMDRIGIVKPGPPDELGRQSIVFPATIANIGAGDFLIEATRSWPWTDDWVVTQRIQDGAGGYTERPTTASLVFGGDEHDHWHVRGVEAHRLERVDTGEVIAEVVKIGFCFFDTDYLYPELPRAPTEEQYDGTACEGPFTTGQVVGLSVGWGDVYPSSLPEQRIYIDGLAAGRYRLSQVADPADEFAELDETNNEAWVDFDLGWRAGTPQVAIVDRGPNQ